MRVGLAVLALTVASVAGAGQAAAAEEDAQPSFLTLDRMDGFSRFGLQLDFAKLPSISVTDGFGSRAEAYFQYVLPFRAIGIYAQMPVSYWFNFNGSDQHGVGNPELGAYYMPGGRQTLIFRAGFTIGTASDSPGGLVSNGFVANARLTDLIDLVPKTTAGRLSVSTFHTFAMAFVRADFGFDIAFSTKAASDVYMHANGAFGLRVPYIDMTAELVNNGGLNGGGSFTDRFGHTAALMLRTRGQNLLHLGAVFPLDSATRGDWIISLGYQRAW